MMQLEKESIGDLNLGIARKLLEVKVLGFVPCFRTSSKLRETRLVVCSSSLVCSAGVVVLCSHRRQQGLGRAKLGSALLWRGRNPVQLLKLRLSFQR